MRCFCWLAVVLVLAGCASVRLPDFSGVEQERGLVNWRYAGGSLNGEGIFQRDAQGRLRVVFSKGVVLLVLTQGAEDWTVTGPLARGGWRGRGNAVPDFLAGWVALAEAYGQAAAGLAEVRGEGFDARFVRGGDALERLEVSAVANGDVLRVVF